MGDPSKVIDYIHLLHLILADWDPFWLKYQSTFYKCHSSINKKEGIKELNYLRVINAWLVKQKHHVFFLFTIHK